MKPQAVFTCLSLLFVLVSHSMAAPSSLIPFDPSWSVADVEARIAKGANVNAIDDAEGSTVLMYAAHFSNLQVVQALIKAGADVNARVNTIPTLALATAAKDPKIIQALIDAGADVNGRDGFAGGTALMSAVVYQEDPEILLEIVRILIDAGADVGVRAKTGETALILASEEGTSPEVIQLLKQAAGDVKDGGIKAATRIKSRGNAVDYSRVSTERLKHQVFILYERSLLASALVAICIAVLGVAYARHESLMQKGIPLAGILAIIGGVVGAVYAYGKLVLADDHGTMYVLRLFFSSSYTHQQLYHTAEMLYSKGHKLSAITGILVISIGVLVFISARGKKDQTKGKSSFSSVVGAGLVVWGLIVMIGAMSMVSNENLFWEYMEEDMRSVHPLNVMFPGAFE